MADIQEVRALEALIGRVQVGDRAYATNHDYANGSGEREVIRKTDGSVEMRLGKSVRSQGRALTTSRLRWPEDDQDYEIDLVRRVIRFYNPSHAYVGGGRAITLTVSFGSGGPDTFTWCRICEGRVAHSTHTAH